VKRLLKSIPAVEGFAHGFREGGSASRCRVFLEYKPKGIEAPTTATAIWAASVPKPLRVPQNELGPVFHARNPPWPQGRERFRRRMRRSFG